MIGWHRNYPKIQILTVEELLNGKEVQMPTGSTALKQAERIAANPEPIEIF